MVKDDCRENCEARFTEGEVVGHTSVVALLSLLLNIDHLEFKRGPYFEAIRGHAQ